MNERNETNEMVNKMEEVKYCCKCGQIIDGTMDHMETEDGYMCAECAEDVGMVKCNSCGEWISKDDARIGADGEYYCEMCFDEEFIICGRCGQAEYRDSYEVVYVNGRYGRHEEYWCSDCVRNNAFYCEDCDRYYDNDTYEHYITRGSRNVCENCIRSNYYYCEECDEYVYYDEWDDDNNMCIYCSEKGGYEIKSYHNAPQKLYFGKMNPSWRGLWRGIGIELEIDRDNEPSRTEENELAVDLNNIIGSGHPENGTYGSKRLFFERDGSLNYGFEIITQPHTIEEFFSLPWDKVLQACRNAGYTSHDAGTCGLHVHLSRTIFGRTEKQQARAISKLIRFFDLYYNELLKIARRTEEQANRWAARYNTENNKDAYERGKNKGRYGRYFAVNNTNKYTVEIRLMRGTLNIESFLACIDICVRMAVNSRKISWKNLTDVKRWFDGARGGTIAYIKKRSAFIDVYNNLDEPINDTEVE